MYVGIFLTTPLYDAILFIYERSYSRELSFTKAWPNVELKEILLHTYLLLYYVNDSANVRIIHVQNETGLCVPNQLNLNASSVTFVIHNTCVRY